MTTWANSAEGGSNGVTVSNANSGGTSGTAFSTNAISGTPAYTTTSPLRNNVSIDLGAAGTTGSSVGWANAVIGAITTVYIRVYIRITALPTGATGRILLAKDGDAGSTSWILGIGTGGALRFGGSSGSYAQQTTAVMSAGTIYRVEASVTHGTGAYVARFYELGSGTPVESISGTATVGTDTEWVSIGRASGGSGTFTGQIDDVAVSSTEWIGDSGDVPDITYIRHVIIG